MDVFNKNLNSFLWPFLKESSSNRLSKDISVTVQWALHPYLRSAKQEAQSYKNKEEKKGSPHINCVNLFLPCQLCQLEVWCAGDKLTIFNCFTSLFRYVWQYVSRLGTYLEMYVDINRHVFYWQFDTKNSLRNGYLDHYVACALYNELCAYCN